MIVVDASALVAMAIREPECTSFQEVLERTSSAQIAAVNFLETGMVLLQRGFIADLSELDELIAFYGVTLREDLDLARGAFAAFQTYGKGRHPARLNLADCFAYALAKQLDLPLLYKGDDFAKTDIRSAL